MSFLMVLFESMVCFVANIL